jgi:hypothetical protein
MTKSGPRAYSNGRFAEVEKGQKCNIEEGAAKVLDQLFIKHVLA